MSKKDNIKKLAEINKRLDGKAKLLYIAYKNGKLNLDTLNDDMKNRILKIEAERPNGYSQLKKRLKDEKINNIINAIDNIDSSFKEEDIIDENEEEPNLSERIIVKFGDFKLV